MDEYMLLNSHRKIPRYRIDGSYSTKWLALKETTKAFSKVIILVVLSVLIHESFSWSTFLPTLCTVSLFKVYHYRPFKFTQPYFWVGKFSYWGFNFHFPGN